MTQGDRAHKRQGPSVYDTLAGDLQAKIDQAVELVREVSMQTDPQEMVRKYRKRVNSMRPSDASLSLSRRDLHGPYYRITRSTRWTDEVNPWKQPDRLPVFKGGLLADLIYGNQPRVVSNLKVDPGDPAHEYLDGMRSLIALPLYDRGESINMVVRLMRDADSIKLDQLPEFIVTSNLFGRATQNLVMAEEIRRAYEALDAEFKVIAQIQQSLLPRSELKADGLDVAGYYATAHRAGGDYYDLFPLEDHRSGILIADVSGHGAAAAVVMARMHAALHAGAADMNKPGDVLEFANEHLLLKCRSNETMTTFVTAFYGVFDPSNRKITYSSAGHNPPRWRQADGAICSIAGARELPLGVRCGVKYDEDRFSLEKRDDLLLYTDGIVEAPNPARELFGVDRLDGAMQQPHESSKEVIGNVLTAVERFIEGTPVPDDRTLLALRIR